MRRAVALALLAAAFVWVFVFKASRRMPDFHVYWQVGARAAHAEPIYRVADGEYQFKYFPEFAPLAIPIGSLPLPAAKAVWFAALVVALVTLLKLAVLVLPEVRKPPALLVAILIVGLGKCYVEELVLGQINLLLTLIVMSMILALARGREVLAGLLIALAIIVKPYALIFVPWLAVRGRIRALLAMLGGGAASFLLLAAVYGLRGAVALHAQWWKTVRDTTAGTLLHPENISLAGMYAKWLGPTTAAAWLATATALALLCAAGFVVLARRGVRQPDALEAAVLIAVTPLVSPQGWDYVLVVCTPAVAYLANYADSFPRAARWLIAVSIASIGLMLYDLLGRRLYYLLVMNSVTTLGVLVVIGSLVALRLRKIA